MTNETPWYVSLIVSFLPLVLYCGVIAWHGSQVRKSMTTRDGRSLAQVFDDLAGEMKRFNDLQSRSKL